MAPRVVTVLGDVSPEGLGVTLTHEHMSMSFEVAFVPPKEKSLETLEFSLGNLGKIRQHQYSNWNNLIFNDEESEKAVMEDVAEYKRSGGGCLVENSTLGLNRKTSYLVKLSKETGIKIVAGTGFYVAKGQNQETLNYSVEDMAKFMRKEIHEGCWDDPSVKCGLIGEIGCTEPLHAFERRVLEASAIVQEECKCAVSIHPGRSQDSPFKIMRHFLEAGGRAEKTIMSHLERTILSNELLVDFAKEFGCYNQFDLFGRENSYYGIAPEIDFPSDAQRMDYIKALIDDGFEDKILISHDIHTKHRLEAYGGHGFSHILKNSVPKMRDYKNISQQQIDKILIANPAQVLELS